MASTDLHDLLKEHHGSGILTLSDGAMVPVAFRFPPGPETDNRIYVAVKGDARAIAAVAREASRDPLCPCRFSGTTDEKATVACEQVFVDKITARWPAIECDIELFPSSDIVVSYPREPGVPPDDPEHVFLLCNLLFRGDEMVERSETMDPGRTTICLPGGDIRLTMLREHDETRAELGQHPKGLLTAAAHVASPRPMRDVFNDTILPVCMLATLAEHCYVVPACSATRDRAGWRSITYQPLKTYPFAAVDPAVDISRTNRRALKEFVEGCYASYIQWKDALKLDVLIEYAVNGSLGQTRETKYLMFCVGFECLANCGERVLRDAGIELPLPGYEKNVELLTAFLRDRSVAVSDIDLQKLARSVSYNRSSMRARLEGIFKYVHVAYSSEDLDFIDVRHALVHTGLFPSEYGSALSMHELEDFYDRVVLTILNYRGRARVARAKRFRTESL